MDTYLNFVVVPNSLHCTLSLALREVLDMLDLGRHPDKVYSAPDMPRNEKDTVFSVDSSDVEWGGWTVARLLNPYSELVQTDHDGNNVFKVMPFQEWLSVYKMVDMGVNNS